MKVLFISALLPYPLHSGGQVRMFNLLRELSKEHEITLFSFVRSPDETKHLKQLPWCHDVRTFLRGNVRQPKHIWRALTSAYPLLVASYDNSEMKRAIADELSRTPYDCIHIEPFYVYPVVPSRAIPLVVSEHNIEYQVYEKLAQSLPTPIIKNLGDWDVKKMIQTEEAVWQRADRITAVSSSDASHIRRRVGEKKVAIVPNGIDPTYFSYTTAPFDRKSPKLLFVGNFSWKPNEDALRILMKRYWPRIHELFPQAILTVCGKHISHGLLQALQQKQVTYLESVDDIRTLYASHDMLLAPFSYGGGTKFKILESMASGTLVVTTKAGIEGIEAVDHEHCLIAGDDASFVSSVAFAYEYPKKAQHVTKRARTLVERVYTWKEIAAVLSGVWKELI